MQSYMFWLSFLTIATYLWTVVTGVTALTTSARAKEFHFWDIWDGIKSTIWIPMMLVNQDTDDRARKLQKLDTLSNESLHYAGAWLTTIASIIFFGLLVLWTVTQSWEALGTKVSTVWCIAHIISNGGKSAFHVKAIMTNLQGESRRCDTVQINSLQH